MNPYFINITLSYISSFVKKYVTSQTFFKDHKYIFMLALVALLGASREGGYTIWTEDKDVRTRYKTCSNITIRPQIGRNNV